MRIPNVQRCSCGSDRLTFVSMTKEHVHHGKLICRACSKHVMWTSKALSAFLRRFSTDPEPAVDKE